MSGTRPDPASRYYSQNAYDAGLQSVSGDSSTYSAQETTAFSTHARKTLSNSYQESSTAAFQLRTEPAPSELGQSTRTHIHGSTAFQRAENSRASPTQPMDSMRGIPTATVPVETAHSSDLQRVQRPNPPQSSSQPPSMIPQTPTELPVVNFSANTPRHSLQTSRLTCREELVRLRGTQKGRLKGLSNKKDKYLKAFLTNRDLVSIVTPNNLPVWESSYFAHNFKSALRG